MMVERGNMKKKGEGRKVYEGEGKQPLAPLLSERRTRRGRKDGGSTGTYFFIFLLTSK